jgi:DNA-binding beta-propeller fold protein YncE
LEGQRSSSTNNSTNKQSNVFISYAREDYVAAGRLYENLKGAGLNPWLDKESLIAGQNWKIAINNAIKKSRYVIPIFSSVSVAKRGYVQKEFKYALDVLDEFPESAIFVIPVRLDDCEIPYEKLRDIDYVDLFPRWEDGIKRILQAMGVVPDVPRLKVNDKNVQTEMNTHIEITLSEGDSDLQELKFFIVDQPKHGTIRPGPAADAKLYTPNSGFTGTDNFEYKATDKQGSDSNVATVSITVKPKGISRKLLVLTLVAVIAVVGIIFALHVIPFPPVPPNEPPIADAGSNLTVSAGDKVNLDGSNSRDLDGSIGSYLWRQPQGPVVTLYGSNTANPSFTAPKVNSNTILTFNLVVKDNKGAASAPSNLDVLVRPQQPVGINNNASPISPEVNYRFIRQWGSAGSGDGQFHDPKGIATDPLGNVYVADSGNNRIQKFDGNGTFIAKWTSYDIISGGKMVGLTTNQFHAPEGIATDPLGNVYVADTGGNGVQKFTGNGTLIKDFTISDAKGIATDISQNIYVAQRNNQIVKSPFDDIVFSPWGNYSDFKFTNGVGVAVDSSGNVYVADTGNNRIEKFTSNGTLITTWGKPGKGDGQFISPLGIAVDPSGNNVYVADTGNNRIQKFDSDGKFITKVGSAGSGDGHFLFPTGVAVDPSGNLYIVEQGNHRIQVFSTCATSNPTLAKVPMIGPLFCNGNTTSSP